MDGVTQAVRYGHADEDREAQAFKAAAEVKRVVNAAKARINNEAIVTLALQLEKLQTRILDLGGMDALIRAQDIARAEMVRRRRREIEAEGWIV